jgi:hypothetical protein
MYLRTPEDDPLQVETCSVFKSINVVSTVELVKLVPLLVVFMQQDANNMRRMNELIRFKLPSSGI